MLYSYAMLCNYVGTKNGKHVCSTMLCCPWTLNSNHNPFPAKTLCCTGSLLMCWAPICGGLILIAGTCTCEPSQYPNKTQLYPNYIISQLCPSIPNKVLYPEKDDSSLPWIEAIKGDDFHWFPLLEPLRSQWGRYDRWTVRNLIPYLWAEMPWHLLWLLRQFIPELVETTLEVENVAKLKCIKACQKRLAIFSQSKSTSSNGKSTWLQPLTVGQSCRDEPVHGFVLLTRDQNAPNPQRSEGPIAEYSPSDQDPKGWLLQSDKIIQNPNVSRIRLKKSEIRWVW